MRSTLLAAAAVAALALPTLAGPITPPPGPVASTGKPLAEVEPRIAVNAANTPGNATRVHRITQPGSYYLTANVNGTDGKSGIEIAASNVTLDLNGFAVIGVPDSQWGILANGDNISIVNGTVTRWGEDGIGASGDGHTYRNLRVSHNSGDGIGGAHNVVVEACTATENTGRGILVGANGVVIGCSVARNGAGIRAYYGSRIVDCSSRENSGVGYQLENDASITDSVAYDNGAEGIRALGQVIIRDCVANGNGSHGILVGSRTFVINNLCEGNGFGASGIAGIRATGNGNRIEGNTSIGNSRGVTVLGVSNVIVRNTCASNTAVNWDLGANNVLGPIIDRRTPGSAAVFGNAAPDSTGSTHPNANFTH